MKTKYKKIAVALQVGVMTSLICVAVPNYASDIELYKAPQSSKTTIMFMMDVSGSMNFCDNGKDTPDDNLCTNGRKTRLDLLKDGMENLLVGNQAKGVEPLPDQLVVGLSEFGHLTGRIKLEAKALGDYDNLGNKEVYKITVPTTYSGSRIQTRNLEIIYSKTRELVVTETRSQQREQYRERTRSSQYSIWPSYSGNYRNLTDWSDEAWSDGGNSGTWTNWTDWVTPGWYTTGNITSTTPTVVPTRGESVVQQCVDWVEPTSTTNISCKTWVNSTLRPDQIEESYTLNSNQDSNYNFSWTSSGWQEVNSSTGSISNSSSGPTQQISSGNAVSQTPINIDCPTPSQTCQREKRIQTRTQTRTTKTIQTQQRLDTSTEQRTQTSTAVANQVKTYTGEAHDTHRRKMLRAIKGLTAANGTPTAFAYAEVAAYMMGQTTKGETYTGFVGNTANISNADKYLAPSSVTKTKQCNTQGIYFLTDGVPEYGGTNRSAANMMKKALNVNSFTCSNKYLGSKSSYYNSNNNTNNWTCIGDFTKRLLDGGTQNPAGVSIKTAVVGFGDTMAGTVPVSAHNNDVADAQAWGTLGGGGFYKGSNDQAIVDSVLAFLKKLQKYIPPVTTGSVTVPVDNLDTQHIPPWAYFPQFDPQPDAQVTTWVGNLKKYQVLNNVLKDRDGGKVVDETTGVSVDDPNDYWADESIKKIITKVKYFPNGTSEEQDIEVRVGGAVSQFRLGLVGTTERKIFTDRKVSVVDQNVVISQLDKNKNLIQIKSADLKTNNVTNHFSKDVKRGYLAALLGYDMTASVASALTTNDSNNNTAHTNFKNMLVQDKAVLRQMGAVMHSKPILITQEGKQSYTDDGDLIYVDRDDLIVFGTTQGLLHVVRAGQSDKDANAGKEVFTFVPHEMIEKQHSGFLNQKEQSTTLMYGIDGQWTPYTEYVTKKGPKSNTAPQALIATVKGGKQWLYGGLRMGGKSYYALDFSDVTSTSGTPKLKFRIDPESVDAYTPLSYMGQSWSKPTLTWVNWKGTRKLVMLVGGGYDPIYEKTNYNPSSSIIDQGAGVYMFDADDGSLLWWSSANATAKNTKTETYHANMKRSVVSQIKAIDRNNDGLADHLYFGDLGGQLWRVDLNASKNAGVTENLADRVVRIMDMSGATHVPRFYTTPTFTIHNSINGLFAVVSVGSGNLSSPMSAPDNHDALYVVYDKDVTKRNLSVLNESELVTVDIMTDTYSSSDKLNKKLLKNTEGTEVSTTYGGWYYPLQSKHRILNDNVAIVNTLYTSVFDATLDIDDVDCYGGIRGQSIAKQFCLPFGKCKTRTGGDNSTPNPNADIYLGKGNIGISFGGKDKDRGLVLNLDTSHPLKQYKGKNKFISQRWYER